MANQLKVAVIQSILALHELGWSNRRIARELGVHRETVGRYVQLAGAPTDRRCDVAYSKPANGVQAPTEVATATSKQSDPPAEENGPWPNDSKPAKAPTGSQGCGFASVAGLRRAQSSREAPPGRAAGPVPPRSASLCRPYRDQILSMLEQGLSATRIHQDLLEAYGQAAPSYYSVRRFIRSLTEAQPLPFRRMECDPGAEAQVDFGTGAPVIEADGRRRKTHVFRIVLSHSRKAYCQAVYRQSTDDFIQCLENAFHHFGGVPKTLVLDNLRAAVSKADWFDPEINPKMQSFCQHYGIVALPTKPRMPRHKGKIERGIDYVQENGLKGHTFTSLTEQNQHLLHWETTIADTRIHGTTKRQVQAVFEQIERAALQPLPIERFPSFQEGQRIVNRDGHVEVAKAYYSVPPEYLGHTVWVRWDSHMVRIFDGRMRPIAIHARCEDGRFSTDQKHISARKINGIERGAAYLLSKAQSIGPHAGQWAEAMIEHRGIEGMRVLQGLASLTRTYSADDIDQACHIACSHGAYRLRTIRQLAKRHAQADSQQNFAFIEEHPIIRSLADYGQIVHQSILRSSATAKDESFSNGVST